MVNSHPTTLLMVSSHPIALFHGELSPHSFLLVFHNELSCHCSWVFFFMVNTHPIVFFCFHSELSYHCFCFVFCIFCFFCFFFYGEHSPHYYFSSEDSPITFSRMIFFFFFFTPCEVRFDTICKLSPFDIL